MQAAALATKPCTLASCPLQLLGAEIIDESDVYVDNAQTTRVDAGELSKQLPARLRRVLARGTFTPRVGRLGVQHLGSTVSDADMPSGPSSNGGALAPAADSMWATPSFGDMQLQPDVAGGPATGSMSGGAAGGASMSRAVGAHALGRQPSSPMAINAPGTSVGSPLAANSWAAGANSGARRVRFGTFDARHGGVVLKPRLLDPDDDLPPSASPGQR